MFKDANMIKEIDRRKIVHIVGLYNAGWIVQPSLTRTAQKFLLGILDDDASKVENTVTYKKAVCMLAKALVDVTPHASL